jgi:hypothetical protein
MKNKNTKLNTIHSSLVNGQRRQMIAQINEYGLYDFWADYAEFLADQYSTESKNAEYFWFLDAVTSYHRITNR